MTEAHDTSHGSDHGDAEHGHPPWLAHHFDTPQQQYASSKLGMWIFLLTEILFFSGLFCAYAVYRRNHPEVFIDGHLLLDTSWGFINTIVLIFSSLTMAMAVRAAQLNQRRALVTLLSITIACAFVFLGIKSVEYKSKWDHHLVPGQARIEYFFSRQFLDDSFSPDERDLPERGLQPEDLHYVEEKLAHAPHAEHGGDELLVEVSEAELAQRAKNVRTFIGIYFAMTGLHGLHVIVGIGVLLWILRRSVRGDFHSQYFDPVDCTGLYWHLVDLIWIYLFPLLYLIH